jgi:hypothetical protein
LGLIISKWMISTLPYFQKGNLKSSHFNHNHPFYHNADMNSFLFYSNEWTLKAKRKKIETIKSHRSTLVLARNFYVQTWWILPLSHFWFDGRRKFAGMYCIYEDLFYFIFFWAIIEGQQHYFQTFSLVYRKLSTPKSQHALHSGYRFVG